MNSCVRFVFYWARTLYNRVMYLCRFYPPTSVNQIRTFYFAALWILYGTYTSSELAFLPSSLPFTICTFAFHVLTKIYVRNCARIFPYDRHHFVLTFPPISCGVIRFILKISRLVDNKHFLFNDFVVFWIRKFFRKKIYSVIFIWKKIPISIFKRDSALWFVLRPRMLKQIETREGVNLE